jgi:hypothetical protein
MQTLLTLLLSFVLATGCSHYAKRRGRNSTHWFFAGLFFGIFAFIVLFLLPVKKANAAPASQEPTAPVQNLTILQPDHVGKLWYFLDDGKTQFGPMSFDALSNAWKEGKVREQTFVWNESMENWRRFQEVIKPAQS